MILVSPNIGIWLNSMEFRESDNRIPWNSGNLAMFMFDLVPELTELIPGAELVPECSTLRNRMTAPFSLKEGIKLKCL